MTSMQSSQAKSSRLAILAMVALALIWGYNWVQMKVAVQYASPFTFAMLRNSLGATCLFAVMLGRRQSLKPEKPTATFGMGLFHTAGMYGLANLALVSGGAGKTAVLVYTMPFWVVMMAWFVLGERVRSWQWAAISLGLVGFLFILEPQNLGGSSVSKLLAIAAGICWAIGSIITKKVQQHQPLELLSMTAWQTGFGALILAVVVLLVPQRPTEWTPQFITALLYAVVPGTAIAQFLWMYILSNLPAGVAGLGTLLNPVFGVCFAAAQLGERPGPSEQIGMAIILLALAVNALQIRPAAASNGK
jgi:drug/metabolite transporter (DMT)-like permease